MATITKHDVTLGKLFSQINMEMIIQFIAILLVFFIPISSSITNILLMLLILFWLCAKDLKSRVHAILKEPVAQFILLFLGFLVFGCLYTDATDHDIGKSLWKMLKLLLVPIMMSIFMESRWRKLLYYSFFCSMMLTLILSMLKMYANLPIYSRYTEACVFKNHIDTNLMMAYCSFLTAHELCNPHKKLYKFIILGVIALLSFYVLIMSEGRTGYFIFIMLALLFFIQRFKIYFAFSFDVNDNTRYGLFQFR